LVRLFIYLFNLDVHKLLTAAEIYRAAKKHFNMHSKPCPGCKTKGHLSSHGEYGHHLVDYYGGGVRDGSVEIDRVYCKSCKDTYSVLPDLFVPNTSYSILFIMLVLRAVMLRKKGECVETVCKRYRVAVSTYYRWKKRYRTYKSLCLGALGKYLYEEDPHLKEPINIFSTDFLYGFYQRFGFSFLEHSKAAESGGP